MVTSPSLAEGAVGPSILFRNDAERLELMAPRKEPGGASRRRSRKAGAGVAGAAAAALALTGTVAGTAAAAPTARLTTAAAAPAGPGLVITPDASQQGPAFEGWGTSLAWFAEVTGGYSDEVKDKLADLVFGEDGLNLNLARFNIGGGNAPDVPAYLRPGGAIPGWWKAPAGTTRTDVDWWDPDDPADWNWDADPNQTWWIDKIKKIDATKGQPTTWEAFSNSPPWFMTTSGYVSGGFNATTDQLKTSSVDDYTRYLTEVVDHLEQAHGISFASIDPFNEPNTNYWGTTLGSDGNPTGGRQEGAHMSPALMSKVAVSLQSALGGASTKARIAAMDETNPGTFVTDWFGYTDEARAAVSRLNVHTYGTGQRTAVRDIAKAVDKPLWMSEVEGSWGSGQSFTSMDPGIGMASHITDDLRELDPSAWVLWQPVEDYDNMAPGGESAAGANWGEIQMPFDCTPTDSLADCQIRTNTKFDTIRNFTHYIRPGDHLAPTNDTASTAAVDASGTGATVVHTNDATSAQTVTLDLSTFARTDGATVTPVVTSAGGALVKGEPVRVTDGTATLTVPARSVTTFVVDGVSGVAKDAPVVQDGHVYQLVGVQSSRSLAATDDGAATVIRTSDDAAAGQLWRFTKLAGGDSTRATYRVTSASTGGVLAVDGTGALVLTKDAAASAAATARWSLSTTGDGTYVLVNAGRTAVLEVGGQKTADGSPVDVYQPNSGANQRWTIVDATVLSTRPAAVYTVPGRAPELPATVTPVYPDGARGALPVTWKTPSGNPWKKAGTVTVTGTATTALGDKVAATATVTVDVLASAEPARAKAYVGGVPELPETVTAVTKSGTEVERPVTWDAAPAGAYDHVGVVTLAGKVATLDGSDLAATVRVQVTKPVLANVATEAGTTVAASYTENGYPATNVINGVTTEKGWSTWKSGTQDASETLTFGLPEARDVGAVKVYFYKDGSNVSWSDSVQVQKKASDGSWVAASDDVPVASSGGAAPVVEVPVTSDGPTTTLRVLFTNPAGGRYLTVSEVQLLAKSPGQSSDATLASLTVGGKALPGFDPARTAYTLPVTSGGIPRVTADAADPYAEVTVEQAAGSSRTAKVTVRSEDGTASTTYAVTFTLPDWASSTVYDTGDTVAYGGSVWLASWWTQNQKPGDVNGPWQEVVQTSDGTAVWTASRIFDTGDEVEYQGVRYVAQWWTRNQVPGAANGPWKKVG